LASCKAVDVPTIPAPRTMTSVRAIESLARAPKQVAEAWQVSTPARLLNPTTSVPIPKFAYLAARSHANFGIKGTLARL
jgi:hypothetical protein